MNISKEKLITELETNFELKKLKKEQMWLECYLENNSEILKFLGNEEIEEYKKFYKRYYDVIDRIDKFEQLIKEVGSDDI